MQMGATPPRHMRPHIDSPVYDVAALPLGLNLWHPCVTSLTASVILRVHKIRGSYQTKTKTDIGGVGEGKRYLVIRKKEERSALEILRVWHYTRSETLDGGLQQTGKRVSSGDRRENCNGGGCCNSTQGGRRWAVCSTTPRKKITGGGRKQKYFESGRTCQKLWRSLGVYSEAEDKSTYTKEELR